MKNKIIVFIFAAFLFQTYIYSQVTQQIQPGPTNGKDAFVAQIYPSYNFGNYSDLNILRIISRGFSNTVRSYIEIDLSTIPSNAIIIDAKLKLYRFSGSTNSTTIEVNKVIEDWNENSITWSNVPNVTNLDVKTQLVSPTNNIFHIIDVTSHVQEFVNYPNRNKGWRLKYQNETSSKDVAYRSSEYQSDTTKRPLIELSYVLPIVITMNQITHADTPFSDNGSISVNASEGDGTYTYQWIDGSTGNDIPGETASSISGLSPGWYGVEVTDGLGNVSYMAFIVGAKCGIVQIEFQPDGRFIDFTKLITGTDNYNEPYDDRNFSTSTLIDAERRLNASYDFYTESLFRNRLVIPNNINLSSAIQHFYGAYHYYSFGNRSNLNNVAEEWYKDIVTWNTRPSYGTTITTIPTSTSQHQDVALDLTSLYEDFQSGTAINYGQSLVLDYPLSSTNRRMRYRKNSTTASELPKLVITLGKDCIYAHLKYELDGFYHTMKDGEINFVFDQEYEGENLQFNIYNSLDEIVKTQADFPVVPTSYGKNYITIDVSTVDYCIGKGFLYLETINSKGEKKYLRFYNDYFVDGCALDNLEYEENNPTE